ncbi:MAG: porin [Crocinitomicaceae bacterium]|nr:porin [Crocinitomicaceae bacterium]
MKLRFTAILFIVSSGFQFLFAQVTNTATLDTTGGQQIGNTSIGAYLDTYFGYDFNQPADKNVPLFVSSSRHNEFNINLAFIDFRYNSENFRARVVPAFGTYMNSNYASEPGSLRNLLEASTGFKISKKKNIWVDAGILGSPYTNESAISKDHLMYTRSLAPEYVPYYLCGIKTTIPLGKKLNFYLYLINGWQQIRDLNNGKSVGTQLEWRPNNNNLINWNTYVGDERFDLIPGFTNDYRMRYFTDIYWLFNAGKKWSFTSCAYVGMQERLDASNIRQKYFWGQANFIAAFKFSEKFSLAARAEYFMDDSEIMISPGSSPFNGGSTGLCLNYKPNSHALVRLEGRQFLNQNPIYSDKNGNATNALTWVVSSITVWF